MKTRSCHYLPLLLGCLLYRATDVVREIQSAICPGLEVKNTTSLDIVRLKRIVHSPNVIWYNIEVPVEEVYSAGHYDWRKQRKPHHKRCKKARAMKKHHRSAVHQLSKDVPFKGCEKCCCCRAHAANTVKNASRTNVKPTVPKQPLQYVDSYIPESEGLYSGDYVLLGNGKWDNYVYPSYYDGYDGALQSNLHFYYLPQ